MNNLIGSHRRYREMKTRFRTRIFIRGKHGECMFEIWKGTNLGFESERREQRWMTNEGPKD